MGEFSSSSGTNAVWDTVSILTGSSAAGAGAAAGASGSTLATNGEDSAEITASGVGCDARSAAAFAVSASCAEDAFISPKMFFMTSSADISSAVSCVSGKSTLGASGAGAAAEAAAAAASPNITPPAPCAAAAPAAPAAPAAAAVPAAAAAVSVAKLTNPADADASAALPTRPPSTVDWTISSSSGSLSFFLKPNRPLFSCLVTPSTKEMENCMGVLGILAEA